MLLGFICLAKYTNIWKVKYIYLSKTGRKTFFFEKKKKTDFFSILFIKYFTSLLIIVASV